MRHEKEKTWLDLARRKVIKEEYLGLGGTEPLKEVVIFDSITPEVFGEYLCEKRKKDGGLLKPGTYKAMRSGLSYLFKRYKCQQSEYFMTEVSEILAGVKRTANEAVQAGEGNVEEGVRPLPYALYLKINKWLLKNGSKEAIYSRAFSTNTWNLCCRGDNTGNILVRHLLWRSDAIGVPFAHEKGNQLGQDRTKRLPRHCYANPLDWRADYMSANFDYLAVFPELLKDPNGLLFPGSADQQASTFAKYLKTILLEYEEELKEYGFSLDDIGVHSWRKGANTFMNSGSTAGPSGAATCIRGGHTMGSVRDIYVQQEKAGDHYCGRILAGLPINRPEFAVSYPDFVAIKEGMDDAAFEVASAELDIKVMNRLRDMFGHEELHSFPSIRPFLRIGLASHLHHRQELDAEYPLSSPIRCTLLYTSRELQDLKTFVKISMPWEDGTRAYLEATGIPPHTLLLCGQEEVKAMIEQIVPSMQKEMDDRTMNGVLSETRMRQIVLNNPIIGDMRKDIQEVRQLLIDLNERTMGAGAGGASLATGQSGTTRNVYDMWVINNMFRRVPPDWEFPQGPVLNVYQYWHHGDTVRKVSPLKNLEQLDVIHFKGNRKRYGKNLEEVQFLFGMLDTEACRLGLLHENPTRQDTIKAFYKANHIWGLGDTTPTGKKRNFTKITWGTVMRLMPKDNKRRRR
jgi:hypothetical protein